jgi:hypothetical protein
MQIHLVVIRFTGVTTGISMKKLCDYQHYFWICSTKPLKKKYFSILWLIQRFFNSTRNGDLRISGKAATFELRSFT